MSTSIKIPKNDAQNPSTDEPMQDVRDPICVRFIRKKFECIMTFMVLLIVLSQIYTNTKPDWLSDKVDLKMLPKLFQIFKQFAYNSTLPEIKLSDFTNLNSSLVD